MAEPTQQRVRKFHRTHELPDIVGKGRSMIEADVKRGWLKISRIGPRATGCYEDDLIEYQKRLELEYGLRSRSPEWP